MAEIGEASEPNEVVRQARVLSVDPTQEPSADELLDKFLAYVESLGVALYPAQEEAILAIASGENVVLNTPTGSGKSLVARALHYVSFASGRRSVYTCPIKALVNEKFFELCETFGPEHVGMMTGDATVNPDAPILCATAEIVSNWALREGEETAIDDLVMDEFHYYADKERGVAWQVPLLTLRNTRMLLMSATMSDVEVFAERLTKLNGIPSRAVRSSDRPVPLEFIYKEIALHEVLTELVRESKIPAYVVCFTQRECSEVAQALTSLDWLSKEDKKKVAELLRDTRFDTPYGKEVQRYLRAGLGIHHAGLLPKYRRAVERLAQTGLLRVICGTDTLGVGINVPIRTVVFTKLCKYDGEKTILLPVRDFKQIAGRAGRKGFDTHGTVIALAPEHVIENLKLEAKAGNDPAKKRKIVRRKPPERGYVPWDRTTFERLSTAEPEPLQSRFAVSHSMVLEILQRGEGWKPLAYLLRDSHERHVDKRAHGRRAIALFRSLLDAGVVEQRETVNGFRFAVNPDLQREFSLHHTLSLFLYQALEKIDKTEPMYPLFLLSLVESIAENPEAILFRQVDVAKKLLIEDLKRQGVEYEARMEALEKVEHPKPDAGLIYDLFNAFAATHPWIGKENVRPKSIAREMFEGFFSFNDYVKEYELGRVEGLLLRYLSEVYKILVQSVPQGARTSDVEDAIDYLGSVVRRVDATLIEEWESLRRGEAVGERVMNATERDEPASLSEKQLLVMIRNELFSYLRALRSEAYGVLVESANGQLTEGELRKWFAGFSSEWGTLDLSANARSAEFFLVEKSSRERWIARQILRGDDGASPYAIVLDVDAAASRKEGTLTLVGLRVEPA